RSIRSALRGLDIGEVKPLIGRIGITLGPAGDWSEIGERLSALPGLGNFSFAHEVPPDIDALADGIVAGVAGRTTESFRVLARRADKRVRVPSPEIERIIGARGQAATGWRVNLSHPALVIR